MISKEDVTICKYNYNVLLYISCSSINAGIPIVITIINSQGGSDALLFAVQKGLNRLSSGLEIDVTIEVTDRHGMYNYLIIITYLLTFF